MGHLQALTDESNCFISNSFVPLRDGTIQLAAQLQATQQQLGTQAETINQQQEDVDALEEHLGNIDLHCSVQNQALLSQRDAISHLNTELHRQNGEIQRQVEAMLN